MTEQEATAVSNLSPTTQDVVWNTVTDILQAGRLNHVVTTPAGGVVIIWTEEDGDCRVIIL